MVAALVLAVTPSAWAHVRRSRAVSAPAQAHAPSTAKAWGANEYGQLGNGTEAGPEKCGRPASQVACSTTPVAVSGLSGVSALAAGSADPFSHVGVALLEGGTVFQWGQLIGDVPVAVCAVGAANEECPSGPFLNGATAVSAGETQALALLSSGEVVAWGNNVVGQLGDGTFNSSKVPVPVCAVGAAAPCSEESKQLKAIAIAAGGEHGLALLSNDTVVAWGAGNYGQLGDGTHESSTVPVPVCAVGAAAPCSEESKQLKAIAIAAGFRHNLALLEGGTVAAWGAGESGQLGNGGTTPINTVPVQVSALTEVTAIAAGFRHSLALLKGGTVRTWGSNSSGQLGDGMNSGPEACGPEGCSTKPVEVCAGTHPGPFCGTLEGATAIAAGGLHSLALLKGGAVVAWGGNGQGQLGTGTSEGPEVCTSHEEPVCSTIPVAVSHTADAQGIAAGGSFSLAFGPPPTVAAIHLLGKRRSHAHGPSSGGTKVSITGLDFVGVSAVKFGPTNAASFTVNSPTSITAVSPPGKPRKTVDVTVTNVWGASATTQADHFRYRR